MHIIDLMHKIKHETSQKNVSFNISIIKLGKLKIIHLRIKLRKTYNEILILAETNPAQNHAILSLIIQGYNHFHNIS